MLKAFIKLLSGSLIGKVIGVVRESLTAFILGTNSLLASLRISQTSILIPANFLTSEVLTSGFLPYFVKLRNEDEERSMAFLQQTFFLLLICSLMLLGGLVVYGRLWLSILSPGFNDELIDTSYFLLLIMLPGLFFYLAGSLFSYVEVAKGNFWLTSFRSTMQSLGLIIGVIAYWLFSEIYLLAIGFSIAYGVFFVIGFVRNFYEFKTVRKRIVTLELKEFWSLSKYLFILPVFLQGSIASERAVASLIDVSVIPALDYAKFITQTSLMLTAIPLGLIGLSTFGKLSPDETSNKLNQLVPLLIIFSIPFSFILFQFSEEIILILFKRGAFDVNSVNITSNILYGMSFGFWAEIISYFLLKVKSAQLNSKYVAIVMGLALSIRILINYLLFPYFSELALGLSSSIYGLILFLIVFIHFDLFKKFSVEIVVLLLFGFIITVTLKILPSLSSFYLNLLLRVFVFSVMWFFLFLISPRYREHIMFVKSRVLDR